MPGYQSRILELDIAGHPYRLRALSDRQPFADPDATATAWAFPRRSGACPAEQEFVVERARCAPHEGGVRGHLLHCRPPAGSNPPTSSG